jgi:hypothetical protein
MVNIKTWTSFLLFISTNFNTAAKNKNDAAISTEKLP